MKLVAAFVVLCVLLGATHAAPVEEHFSGKLRSLAQVALCVNQTQDVYNAARTETVRVNPNAVVTALASDIANGFGEKIISLERLVTRLTTAYATNEKPSVGSAFGYCQDVPQDLEYEPGFARPADITKSCTRLPWYVEEDDSDVQSARRISSALTEVMEENHREFGTLKWQYFGHRSGFTRTYPARYQPPPTSRGREGDDGTTAIRVLSWIFAVVTAIALAAMLASAEGKYGVKACLFLLLTTCVVGIVQTTGKDGGPVAAYDPRFRPWYVSAATQPKNLVIVIDSSGSMGSAGRMEVAKAAADTVLSTVNPNDYVSVVDFNSVARAPQVPRSTINADDDSGFGDSNEVCYEQQLVPASPRNVAALRDFVSSLGADGGTDFSAAFRSAFGLLLATPSNTRNNVIVFLTDGDAPDPTSAVDAGQSSLSSRAKIFTYALGGGVSDAAKDVLKSIADANDGVFEAVDDGGDLRTAMGSYYDHPSLLLPAGEQNYTLAPPYFDADGLGLVTTVSAPVFNGEGELEGIMGVDVSLEDIVANVTYLDLGPNSYAFVINDKGETLMHPLLPSPSAYDKDPIFLDISLLEPADGFTSVRASMLAGNSGSTTLTTTRVLHRGDAEEGGRTRQMRAIYQYAPVGDLPYRVCVVVAESDLERPVAVGTWDSELQQYYHRVDIVPAPGTEYIGGGPTCSQLYGDTNLTRQASTIKLAPRSFQQPYDYLQNGDYDIGDPANRGKARVEALNTALNADNGPSFPDFKPSVQHDVTLSQQVEKCWLDAAVEGIGDFTVWRYIGTEGGMWRSFPGHPSQVPYDPSRRPWYFRSLTNPGLASLSTYLDSSGAGVVTTLSAPIFHNTTTDYISAVMGIDLKSEHIQALLDESVADSGVSSDGDNADNNYILMDFSGFIVYHPDMGERGGLFITELEAQVGAELTARAVLVQEECNDYTTASIRRYYRVDHTAAASFTSTCEGLTLKRVPGHNLYLITRPAGSCLDGDICQRGSECSSLACPCVRDAQYNPCTNTFADNDLPACPAPITPLPDFQEPAFCFPLWASLLIAIPSGICLFVIVAIFCRQALSKMCRSCGKCCRKSKRKAKRQQSMRNIEMATKAQE